MPNPLFEPIIGRDFGDIGAQRYAWAGFNANIEAQNLARAAAAQDAQNRWALTAAQMAREDAARQAAIDARAQENALSLGLSREQMAYQRAQDALTARRQEKQFGEQMTFAREDLAARGEQAGEKLKLIEEQQKARIDFNGERYAAQYGVVQAQKAAADAAHEAAQAAFDKAESDLAAIAAKTKRTEEDTARQMALSTSLPKLKADLRLATSAASRANRVFDTLEARITAGDYDINHDTGKISHPLGSREWSFAKAVSEASRSAATPLTPPPATPAPTTGGVSNWFKTSSLSPYVVGQGLGKWLRTPRTAPAPLAPVAAPVETAPGLLNPTPADVGAYEATSRYAPNLLLPPVDVSGAAVNPDFAPKMPLDRGTAQAILNEARGDRDLARQIARERGYSW